MDSMKKWRKEVESITTYSPPPLASLSRRIPSTCCTTSRLAKNDGAHDMFEEKFAGESQSSLGSFWKKHAKSCPVLLTTSYLMSILAIRRLPHLTSPTTKSAFSHRRSKIGLFLVIHGNNHTLFILKKKVFFFPRDVKESLPSLGIETISKKKPFHP